MLTTEPQARALAATATLIVREKRGPVLILVWLCVLALCVAGLSYPFWRPYLQGGNRLPPGFFAVFGGLFCLLFVALMRQEITAARQPSSWVLMAGVSALYLKFRDFRHWRWPEQDKVVLQLSPSDVDYIQPVEGTVTIRSGKGVQKQLVRSLEFHLRDALLSEQADAIRYENTHMGGSGKASWRSGSQPLRVSADGQVICLNCSSSLKPPFAEIIRQLQGRYQVRPVTGLEQAAVLKDGTPRLTEQKLREVALLAAGGDKIGAIRLLRDYSGLGLKEAKDAVEAGVETSLAHLLEKQP